ncbi:MAG: hypothetical protein QM744_02770 [Mesorhizobium sp.]
MKRLLALICVCLSLVGCDKDVGATLHVRDIKDVLTSSQAKNVPVEVSLDILQTGIAEQCAKLDCKAIIDVLSSGFEDVRIEGCEKRFAGLNDRLTIRARTVLELGNRQEIPASKFLLSFFILKYGDKNSVLFARFDNAKFMQMQSLIQDINVMARPRFANITIAVTISNEERESVRILADSGSFLDGKPIVQAKQVDIPARGEVQFQLGDVKQSFLASNGYVAIVELAPLLKPAQ